MRYRAEYSERATKEPKKLEKYFFLFHLSLILILMFPQTAWANSSWVWISETRPWDILPFVIIGTLFVETVGVSMVIKTRKIFKIFCVICLGNMLSFGLAYLMPYIEAADFGYSFQQMLSTEFYTAGIGLFLLTIAVELPVEYLFLRKDTSKPRALACAIIVCNVITTVGVGIVERTVCQGQYL